MNEPPTRTEPIDSADSPTESKVGRIGVRALLVLMLLLTACVIALLAATQALRAGEAPVVIEPVASLCLLAVGYYFGQKTLTK